MKKLLLIITTAFSYALTTNNTFRISYQNLKFQNEHLGLLETSYLFNFNNFYGGIGVYSAVSGKRGGFFTGGINIGYKYPISSIFLDIGSFIGAGGGGAAPQGSGLMIKVYSGIMYKYKNLAYGININKIKFKDGSINSTQLGFILDYNFKDYYFLKPVYFIKNADTANLIFTPVLKIYKPINSKTTTEEKQSKFAVIGGEVKKLYSTHFIYFEAAGAFEGQSDGYAELLFGIGKKFKYLNIKGFIGSAGGGKVDTKSGLLAGMEISKNFSLLHTSVGFLKSDGTFKAYYIKTGINKKFNFVIPGKKSFKIIPEKFNIKIYSQSYLPSNTIRKNRESKRLDVLNINLGKYINKSSQIFINAAAAYNGDSGGYAVGSFGYEYEYKNIFTQISIGAAGGGNVDVGGGIIAKATLGYKIKNFFVSVGRIKALKGKLNTTTLSVGYSFDFYKGIK